MSDTDLKNRIFVSLILFNRDCLNQPRNVLFMCLLGLNVSSCSNSSLWFWLQTGPHSVQKVSERCRPHLSHSRLERDQRVHAARSRFLLSVPARLPHRDAGTTGTTNTHWTPWCYTLTSALWKIGHWETIAYLRLSKCNLRVHQKVLKWVRKWGWM